MNSENFGSLHTDSYQFYISVAIFIVSFAATKFYRVNPILMIVICGALGAILYWFFLFLWDNYIIAIILIEQFY